MTMSPVSKLSSRWSLLNPVGMFRGLWKHRELTAQMTRREIAGRYRSTILGMIWPIIIPLVLLTVYAFTFGIIFSAKWRVARTTSHLEYALTLFTGIILYNLFSETVGNCSQVIVINTNFVKRVVFPLEILPLVQLSTAAFHALISLAVWLVGTLIFVGLPPLTALYFPMIFLLLCAFALGLGWIVSALGVFIRDISQAVTVALQVLFFGSAVFFSLQDVPKQARWLMNLNPIAILIESARRTLMWGQAPDWHGIVYVLVVALITMQLGYYCFMRSKRAFSDVL